MVGAKEATAMSGPILNEHGVVMNARHQVWFVPEWGLDDDHAGVMTIGSREECSEYCQARLENAWAEGDRFYYQDIWDRGQRELNRFKAGEIDTVSFSVEYGVMLIA